MTRLLVCGFELGSCRRLVTTALRVGQSTRFRTLACDEHATKIIQYQARMGVLATPRHISTVDVELPCAAAWGSHGCSLGERHRGVHRCADRHACCGASPARDERVYSHVTLRDCARIGGVVPVDRLYPPRKWWP